MNRLSDKDIEERDKWIQQKKEDFAAVELPETYKLPTGEKILRVDYFIEGHLNCISTYWKQNSARPYARRIKQLYDDIVNPAGNN